MCDRKCWKKLEKYIEHSELEKFRSYIKRYSVDVIGLLDEQGNSLLHLSCKFGCEVILRSYRLNTNSSCVNRLFVRLFVIIVKKLISV